MVRDTSNRQIFLSYHNLQKTVGWVALLMPISVRLLAYLFQGIFGTTSISAYYYTDLRDVFVGSLVIGGVVLAFFRSNHERDKWAAIAAGIAAMGIGLCPMTLKPGDLGPDYIGTAGTMEKMIEALRNGTHGPLGYHFFFVCVFFILTFYLVTFRFRANTPASPSSQKMQRNTVYVICGCLMGASFVWMSFLWIFDRQGSVFWPETLGVMSFSVAWLVKGQLVLKD